MKNIEQIRKMWNDYQNMTFPENYAGKDINDICITTLDTFAAGCINSYVENGNLDINRIKILKSCLDDLDLIIPKLNDYPKEYFLALKDMCVVIVKKNNVHIIGNKL
jgi:hypothetical protein